MDVKREVNDEICTLHIALYVQNTANFHLTFTLIFTHSGSLILQCQEWNLIKALENLLCVTFLTHLNHNIQSINQFQFIFRRHVSLTIIFFNLVLSYDFRKIC